MKYNLVETDNLEPVLNVLSEEDSKAIVALKEELADTFINTQVFRTETEMRVSVLNDKKHPTNASKYYQALREQNGMFQSLIGSSFAMRRLEINKMRLEEEYKTTTDKFRKMEIQVDLDENLVAQAGLKRSIDDRVREIKIWSTIKKEVNDGSFDTQDCNAHQLESYEQILANRTAALSPYSSEAEVINAMGPLQTARKYKQQGFKQLDSSNGNLTICSSSRAEESN